MALTYTETEGLRVLGAIIPALRAFLASLAG